MKKIVIVFASILMGAQASQAQVSFGLKAGLNVSSLRYDTDDDDIKSKLGANAGVFASIPAVENFFIQPEILYSLEGAKSKEFDFKQEMNFINIPIMFQYKKPIGFYAELGPQLGFLSSAKVKSDDSSFDIKDELKSFNFSAAIGAGYNFSPGLGAGLRYALGLSNLADDSEGGELKTSNFSIGIQYTFGK